MIPETVMVFKNWLKRYSLLEEDLIDSFVKVRRFMILNKTRGSSYLQCHEQALSLHVL